MLRRVFNPSPQIPRARRILGRHGPMMLGTLAMALMWLGAAYSVNLARGGAEQAAIDSTANLARAFEQHIVRTIQSIDQSLKYLRASFARNPESFDIGQWVDHHQTLTDIAFQFGIIDENGMLAGTNLPAGDAPVDLSGREHFRVHVSSGEDTLFISNPVLGRVSGKWSLQFTRKLYGRDDQFAGVAVVSVDPDRLSEFYKSIDIGPHGAVVLLGRDGLHKARATSDGSEPVHSYKGEPFFARMLGTGTGSMTLFSPEDGVVRIYSYRAVAGYPLLVAVGIGQEDALAAFSAYRNFMYASTTALSALVLAFAWGIRRHQDRLESAHQELQLRSRHYRRVVNGIDDVIFQLDQAGAFVFVNAAWTRLTGFGIRETIGAPITDFICANDRPRINLQGCSRDSNETFGPARFSTRSGGWRWFELRARPEFGEDETVAGLCGTMTDVTFGYVADLAKRESDARANAILQSAADGILSLDGEGRIERVNSGLLRMFKAEEADLLGKPFAALAPAERNGASWRAFERLLDEGAIAEGGWWGEMTCRRFDRTEFPAGVRVSEMILPAGRHFACVVRDITERKKIEEMKDNFVATVSHELRTPMAAIVGALGLLRSGAIGPMTDKPAALIDVAHRNCDRLVRLLNDILDMERIRTGQLDLKLAKIDLNRIVADAASLNRPQADERHIHLVVRPWASEAMVRADADRIVQVLANLISNALKYAPPDSAITIEVSARGPRFRVSVADEGPGVPEEFKAHVFKRFARADSSDNRARGGTGLGLFISQLIVEQHGGEIGFESQTGKGATFFFELSTGVASGTRAAA